MLQLWITLLVATSHMIIWPRLVQTASVLPSGENSMVVADPLYPARLPRSLPVLRSQSLTARLRSSVASVLLSAAKAQSHTCSSGDRKVNRSWPDSPSQTLTVCWLPTPAKNLPSGEKPAFQIIHPPLPRNLAHSFPPLH